MEPGRTTWARGWLPEPLPVRALWITGDASIVAARNLKWKWDQTFRYPTAEEKRAAEAPRRQAGAVAGAGGRRMLSRPEAKGRPFAGGRGALVDRPVVDVFVDGGTPCRTGGAAPDGWASSCGVGAALVSPRTE